MRESSIYKALSKVQDPDLHNDLVTLNMVRDLKIKDDDVSFTVMLTTPACPLQETFRKDCTEVIHEIYPDANITIKFDSKTTTARMDKHKVLPGVRNIIAVVSGKGGVGKSTVATNLALAIAKGGAKVGLMDADIHGPSGHIMMGVKNERPQMRDVNGKPKIIPIHRYGIDMMSIGLLVDERQAVVWRGPMVSSAVRQFVRDVDWGDLDYLVIDMPPGTGDIHLTIIQSVPVTGVVIVTTPQDVALADARKGAAMFRQPGLKTPIVGLIENMSYFTPAELPDHKYYIFGKHGGMKLAEEFDIPFLGEIPLVQSIREGGDIGVPAMMGDDQVTIDAFTELSHNVIRKMATINAQVMNRNATPVHAL